MFSRFANQLEEQKMDDLSDSLLLDLSLGSRKKPGASAVEIQKKKKRRDRALQLKSQASSVKDLFSVKKDPDRLKRRDVTEHDFQPTVSPKERPDHRTNNDLIARLICKQLRVKDIQFMSKFGKLGFPESRLCDQSPFSPRRTRCEHALSRFRVQTIQPGVPGRVH